MAAKNNAPLCVVLRKQLCGAPAIEMHVEGDMTHLQWELLRELFPQGGTKMVIQRTLWGSAECYMWCCAVPVIDNRPQDGKVLPGMDDCDESPEPLFIPAYAPTLKQIVTTLNTHGLSFRFEPRTARLQWV